MKTLSSADIVALGATPEFAASLVGDEPKTLVEILDGTAASVSDRLWPMCQPGVLDMDTLDHWIQIVAERTIQHAYDTHASEPWIPWLAWAVRWLNDFTNGRSIEAARAALTSAEEHGDGMLVDATWVAIGAATHNATTVMDWAACAVLEWEQTSEAVEAEQLWQRCELRHLLVEQDRVEKINTMRAEANRLWTAGQDTRAGELEDLANALERPVEPCTTPDDGDDPLPTPRMPRHEVTS